MALTTLALLGFAFSLDLLFGTPPSAVRPAAWIARLGDALDRRWADARRGRAAGAMIAAVAPLVPAGLVAGAVLVATAFHPTAGAVVTGLVLFLTIDLRSVLDRTRDVVLATDGDLETVRERIPDPDGDASRRSAAVRSRALEDAARALATGLVAPLLAFVVLAPLSVPVAAAAVAWVTAVTALASATRDSSTPIAAARSRLAAGVLWLPARLTAVAIAVAATDPLALRRARRRLQLRSPTAAGWPAATLGCVLSVRLSGSVAGEPSTNADPPTLEDGDRAVAVLGLAAVVAIAVAIGLAVVASALVGGLESP